MAVHPLVQAKVPEIEALCFKHRVQRLDLFGSATRDDFDPTRSDLDFVVEFQELSPKHYYDAFWGLLEGLEQLFDRPIDLVVRRALRNPYFIERVEQTKIPLFHAA
ncbi:MAG TPA: nucleotidyltransferase domain-containing protein [Planctomycetota bacterium]|nr:nucleotidyltransferase domain-containing protein [Planctomycetota bacterium]